MTRTIEEFLGDYRSPRVSVRVTQRADLLAEHVRLQAAHKAAVRGDMSENRLAEAPGIVEQLKAIEAEIAASEFTFTFEALGRQEYLQLLAAHPPRQEDRAERLSFNGETFPPALVAASAVEPTISAEQAEQLFTTLSDAQFSKLWNAALSVNIGDDSAPKSVLRSVTTEQNDGSSTTASPEGSLEAPSSDE